MFIVWLKRIRRSRTLGFSLFAANASHLAGMSALAAGADVFWSAVVVRDWMR